MKYIFTILFSISVLCAQTSWENYLLLPNDSLRKDIVKMETVLDAFQPVVVDSFFSPSDQWHRFVGGRLLYDVLDLHWEAIRQKRTKFVGQNLKNVSVHAAWPTLEHDINFYLVPHLEHYIDSTLTWWNIAGKKERNLFHSFKENPKITIPDKLKILDDWFIYLETENTPLHSHIKKLDSLFYPSVKPNTNEKHKNMNYMFIPLGVYGTPVMDCNHSCKPEIHPYEWIWWMNFDAGYTHKKEFFVGLHRDASKRFKKWSTKPRTGSIKIPFVFEKSKEKKIDIRLINFDKFNDEMLQIHFGSKTDLIGNLESNGIKIETNITEKNQFKYEVTSKETWIDGKACISGYLTIYTSVKNLMELKVSFEN